MLFQTILMDDAGVVLESDNLLFNASSPNQTDIKQLFPVLDSIFLHLKQGAGSRPSLLVQGVEQPSEHLSGIYDFSFQRIDLPADTQWRIEIYDKTAYYTNLIAEQQIAHEKNIFEDIQREHSRAIALQTSALYKQGADRQNRLVKPNTEFAPMNLEQSLELAEAWIAWLNAHTPQEWFEPEVVQSETYREILQKAAYHWLIKDAETVADFEIHSVLNDFADYFTTRSDSNFVELNILYHPNMPVAKLRGNELLVRRVLLGCIINTLKIGGIGSVSLAATPIEYAKNQCKIEISIQVSWIPNLPKQLYDIALPVTAANQHLLLPQTFNLLARYHCLASWVQEAGSKLQILQQEDKGFKMAFVLDFEKL